MGIPTRWIIEGSVTTRTPLHVGSGESGKHPEVRRVRNAAGEEVDPEVDLVVLDVRGLPSIPGTAVRSFIRRLLEFTGQVAAVEPLLGSRANAEGHDETKTGGRLDCWPATAPEQAPVFHDEGSPPCWSSTRLTGVLPSVAIDRRLGAAVERLLYQVEYVPPGVTFDVTLVGHGLTPAEVSSVLGALDAAQDDEAPLVGAHSSMGWGRLAWTLRRVSRIDASNAALWLTRPSARAWGSGRFALPEKALGPIRAAARMVGHPRAMVKLGVRLEFDSHFLSNDASRAGWNDAHAFVPLRDHLGKPWLRASGVRGVIRSQAERILRTIGQKACTREDPCKAVKRTQDLTSLCLVCQVFGASGFRSPLQFGDFAMVQNRHGEAVQEFIAIDRFTGGGSRHARKKGDDRGDAGAKFNAESIYQPSFSGTLTLDLAAYRTGRGGAAGLALLALVLRDLAEGDLVFGARGAVGYGTCRATFTAGSDVPLDTFGDLLAVPPVDKRRLSAAQATAAFNNEHGAVRRALLDALDVLTSRPAA